jgi:DNA-binding response OmpR family regulator
MDSRLATRRNWAASQPPNHTRRVLVTEDNVALRQLMADVLTHEGYRVTEAGDAFEMRHAILQSETLPPCGEAFDLVVSDIFMPGKTGLDELFELRQTGLECPFLLVTSFPDVVAYEHVEKLDVQLLAKPFSLKEFRDVTFAMLAARAMKSENPT